VTVQGASIQILLSAGKPLHAKEIAKRIIDGGLWQSGGKTPDATLTVGYQEANPAQLFGDCGDLAGRHALNHHFHQRQHKGLFAVLVALEDVGREAPIAGLRRLQRNVPDKGCTMCATGSLYGSPPNPRCAHAAPPPAIQPLGPPALDSGLSPPAWPVRPAQS